MVETMLFLEGSFFTEMQDVKTNNKKAKLSLFIQQKINTDVIANTNDMHPVAS